MPKRYEFGYEHQPPLSDWQRYADEMGALRGDRLPPEYRELAQTLDIAAEGACALLQEAYYMAESTEVRRTAGFCVDTSKVFSHILRELGIPNVLMESTLTGFSHTFMCVVAPDRRVLAADPTWQQFLPKGASYDAYPDTLIAPFDALRQTLRAHDITRNEESIWLGARKRPVADGIAPDPDNHVLLELFKERGWPL
jgi:hypothetical protein